MRHDMSKIIVERPRTGGFRGNWSILRANTKNIDPENTPISEGMRKPHSVSSGYERKQLNENLKPLYRFLNACNGQCWNKVFSEICAKINRNSAVQAHVIQHIFMDGFVHFDCVVNKKIICDSKGVKINGFRRGGLKPMYVSPEGILKFLPESQCYKKQNSPFRKTNELQEYHRIDGIWYEINFEPILVCDYSKIFYDVLTKTRRAINEIQSDYGGRLPIKKRQLSKKEIKKLKLKM